MPSGYLIAPHSSGPESATAPEGNRQGLRTEHKEGPSHFIKGMGGLSETFLWKLKCFHRVQDNNWSQWSVPLGKLLTWPLSWPH